VEPEAEAKRLREKNLDLLVEEAIGLYEGSPGRRAELELERRAIAESIKASGLLLVATWVIVLLTAVL
jgi:hypothetical protein